MQNQLSGFYEMNVSLLDVTSPYNVNRLEKKIHRSMRIIIKLKDLIKNQGVYLRLSGQEMVRCARVFKRIMDIQDEFVDLDRNTTVNLHEKLSDLNRGINESYQPLKEVQKLILEKRDES